MQASWDAEAVSRAALEAQMKEAQQEAARAVARVQQLWAKLEEMRGRAADEAERLMQEIEDEERREAQSAPSSSSSSAPGGAAAVPAGPLSPSASQVRAALDAGLFNGSMLPDPFEVDALLPQTLGASGGFSASGW